MLKSFIVDSNNSLQESTIEGLSKQDPRKYSFKQDMAWESPGIATNNNIFLFKIHKNEVD